LSEASDEDHGGGHDEEGEFGSRARLVVACKPLASRVPSEASLNDLVAERGGKALLILVRSDGLDVDGSGNAYALALIDLIDKAVGQEWPEPKGRIKQCLIGLDRFGFRKRRRCDSMPGFPRESQMPSALSADLRQRVVVAIEAGASLREVARRLKVSPANALRWHEAFVREGHTRAKPMGSDQRSHTIAAQADLVRQTYEAKPDLFLRELRTRLAEYGRRIGLRSLSRFVKRHGIPREKHRARRAGSKGCKGGTPGRSKGQLDLKIYRIGYLRNIATNTKVASRYGSDSGGEHCQVAVPLRVRFRRNVEKTQVPTLSKGDTFMLDNLAAHKDRGILERIEAANAPPLALPAHLHPDFISVQLAVAKLKASLRAQAACTIAGLCDTLKQTFARFSPNEWRNCLMAAGYKAFDSI